MANKVGLEITCTGIECATDDLFHFAVVKVDAGAEKGHDGSNIAADLAVATKS